VMSTKPDQQKYSYVQGIAEAVSKMKNPMLTDIDYCDGWTECQYCGTSIKWMFYITDLISEPEKGPQHMYDKSTEIFVGSECIKHFAKYINLEKWKLDRVLSYFNKYQELQRELKTRPSARIEISKLEEEIRKSKEELDKRHVKLAEEQSVKVRELLKLTGPNAPLIVSAWDREFINSVNSQLSYNQGRPLSDKQMKIVDELTARYDTAKLPPAYLEKFKKEAEMTKTKVDSDKKLLNELMDLRLSLYDRPFISSLTEWVSKGQALTDKQREAAFKVREKYHKQLNQVETVKPGVYESEDGIFVVKLTQDKERVYAKKLVESPNRLTESGEIVQFDFEYAPGAIYKLTPEQMMPIERARELMIKYGHCIVCSRLLKDPHSVEQGIGPVCIKYFKGAN
jgi:hypothetical protein